MQNDMVSCWLQWVMLCSCFVGLLAFGQQSKASMQKEIARTGRFKNTIDADTFGCRTIPLIAKAIDAIGHKRHLPIGCFDLNENGKELPVFGPLQVTNPAPTKACHLLRNTCWALVEVPGTGKLWTYLSHLKTKYGNGS
jgi:hypothetical protein